MDYKYFPGLPDTKREIIRSVFPSDFKKKYDVDTIIKSVCTYFDLDEDKVCSKLRDKEYITVRHWIIYFCVRATNLSLKKIGKRFNNNHANIIYIRRTMQDRISVYPRDKVIFEELKERINDQG